ncbi:hypothetical protein CQW23_31242 [Capsicum baccatum]|uniref:Uncharacterized protein n=1 Tax=Capsicum baccatum TaxID=33114 RepID=A0A2G2V862_CAPBA|nr:hypothetical protein CQW23_31242 [Capsicum baccatum]
MVPWCLGATVPWCHNATEKRCHGALVPWCYAATGPRGHGAMVPRCLGATVPWHQGTTLYGSISSSPPTVDGRGTGTPVPSPQSQSFSRSYGSILLTFLAYIVPSTRGCSPWRLDAVMSTTESGRHSFLQIFKGLRERTGHHTTCGALPAAGPYLQMSRF